MMARQMGFDDAPKPPVIDEERSGLYLAFGRRFPKQDAAEVVTEAIDRYRQKMHAEPLVVLTSFADAVDLEGKTALQVQPKTYIASGNFYIGRDAA